MNRIFTAGRVMTPSHRTEALLVEGERIVAVGDLAELRRRAADADVVDFGDATILPGFIETHMHPLLMGLGAEQVTISTPPHGSIADVVDAIRRFADGTADDVPIRAWGFDDSGVSDDRHLTAADLDSAAPDRLVVLRHVSGHIAYANTAVMAAAGIDAATPDPANGHIVRDAAGNPTGEFHEPTAMALVDAVMPPTTTADLDRALESAQRSAHEVGVTTMHDLWAGPDMVEAYRRAHSVGRLGTRIRTSPAGELLGSLGTVTGDGDDWLRTGSLKLFADGSIQGYTACLTEPYHDRPGAAGIAVLAPGELAEAVRIAHGGGWQVSIHTNGDAAIDSALDAIQAALEAAPKPDHRHRLEHVQTPRADQIDRMARLGICVSVFANHVWYWGDRHRDRFLGPERAAGLDPLRSLVAAGVRFGLHCDAPVTPLDPLFTMGTAMARRTSGGDVLGPTERVDFATAIRGYTSDAAYLGFDEHRLGSIEPGKLADLAVVDGDPFSVVGDEVRTMRVAATVVGGQVVYDG